MRKAVRKLLDALATATGGDVSALEAKLEEDGSEETADVTAELAPVLTAHTTKVKNQTTTDKAAGYDKAKKEVLTKFEGELKTANGITSDKTGTDLVAEIVSKKAGDPGQLSEDAVKRSAPYLALENSVTQRVTDAKKELQDKLDERDTSDKRRATLSVVKEVAGSEFDKLNAVMPADATVAAKRRAQFDKAIEAGLFEVVGRDVLLLENDPDNPGKTRRAQDEHGNARKFTDYVKATADDLGFEYKAASDRSSSGNTTTTTTTTAEKKYTGKHPAKGEVAEYQKLLADPALTTEQKVEVQTQWAETNK